MPYLLFAPGFYFLFFPGLVLECLLIWAAFDLKWYRAFAGVIAAKVISTLIYNLLIVLIVGSIGVKRFQ
jgi:hypothetical protein